MSKREPLLFGVEVDMDAIVDGVARLSPDEIIRVVIAIDQAACDWTVSMNLCDHFEALRKDYAEEHARDYPHGCDDEGCADCRPSPGGDTGKEAGRG